MGSIRLFTVILGLAVEVKSDGAYMLTGRRGGNTDPYKIAQKEQWTTATGKGTLANRYLALTDTLTVYMANFPDKDWSEVNSVTEALNDGDLERCQQTAQQWRDEAGL